MDRRPVVSREYKVVFRRNRFDGDEQKLLKAAAAAWRDFTACVRGVVLGVEGDLARIKARRLITFFDTKKQDLNTRKYIFRERRDLENDEREITLKFRHPDRFVAQDRKMDVSGSDHARRNSRKTSRSRSSRSIASRRRLGSARTGSLPAWKMSRRCFRTSPTGSIRSSRIARSPR
jgi:hypothetical protein